MKTLVWFRGKDLRLADHAPLRAAIEGGEVIPLFVLDPYFFAPERAQKLPHRIQFLLDSLVELAANLATRGSHLVVVAGQSVELVPRLADEWRVDRVVAHRWVEPFGRRRDERVREKLGDRFELFEGETLVPPGSIRSTTGQPYSVFSHFARAFWDRVPLKPVLPLPRKLPPVDSRIASQSVPIPTLTDLGIDRNPDLQPGGERAAHERLAAFVSRRLLRYEEERNRMDLAGTSRLSADLKFGTLSVRQVWNAVLRAAEGRDVEAFQNELVWREFTHSTLWDRPDLLDHPFRPEFAGFPYIDNPSSWDAWTLGRTGYPVVDAAARQLLCEGFVHNRARMIAASFLTKHLLIDYRRGEQHYLRYLTDGDWAQNNAGWQWSAGCGCDAQPYFRIFNPVTQGKKFDPDGDYVRRYVPELAALHADYIHAPWQAPPLVLQAAGIRLGETYPLPIIDHSLARNRFLAVARDHLRGARS